MSFSERDRAAMDKAAADAQNDLTDIDDNALRTVANWWKKWFPNAGHKRLGRVLVEYADENAERKGGEKR